ncbi:S-layer protein [Bacillus sp. M6-12]|uniref:S-layer homology domain-containing protein n=1 Tax=Bacillus sp. M6-12 TaxID=2054166 RepID=UPI000C794CA7|nr:S-layer homology domain-containing protein [Bacillus sp. M6-12]PLS17822.1 S-layer protein [Bacillus sp. M6-12]
MKKISTLLLSFLLIISLLPVRSAHADDITGIALEMEMRAMVEKGVIFGYGPGKYGPHDDVSRGQFANFIARALQLPEGQPKFKDVPVTSSLAPGIYSAVAAEIITGYSDGTFKPDDPITREQVANMIDKSLDYLKVPKQKAALAFTDEKLITSSISRSSIGNMVALGIIAGIPNLDSEGNPVGTFRFDPKKTATRAHAAAFIYRMLKAAEEIQEEEDPSQGTDPFKIGTVDAQGNLTVDAKTYKTFDAAISALTNSNTQVVMYNDSIIKMKSGVAVAKPAVGTAAAVIYESDMKTIMMPVATGGAVPTTEMEYIRSDDEKIEVKVAGRQGFVKHTNAYLVPAAMMKGRSYYSVNSAGELVHNIYDINKNTYSAYTTGVAPSFLKQGTKYISWDGNTFKTESGTVVGTAYQYFNMLPARAKTNYTAAELDQYINQALAEREALYRSNPTANVRYKDAATKSKLIGIGQTLKAAESKYKVNALLILAMALHESDFGMSAHALTINNIFGIAVYDSSPEEGAQYATVEDSINSLMNNYLNKNYVPIPASGIAYQNGSSPGNKNRGINVRYAADAYWGQKVAGHMYRVDKALGGKDFLNNPAPYNVGITNIEGLNVRMGAGTSFEKQFTYPKPGYPVIIAGTEKASNGTNWYKIISDSNNNEFAYVSAEYVDNITIAK